MEAELGIIMDFSKARFEAAYGTFSQLPESDLPEIAFSGRSNVGKSSLINKVFNRKALARVSSVPGKTVTVNFYSVDGARIVDLPGYGYAKLPRSEKQRFASLTDGYFNSGRDIRLVVQLIDMRREPTADDRMMLGFLKSTGYPFIVVMTKSDKLNKTEYQKRIEEIKTELPDVSDGKIFPFSAMTGENVDKIRNILQSCLEE